MGRRRALTPLAIAAVRVMYGQGRTWAAIAKTLNIAPCTARLALDPRTYPDWEAEIETLIRRGETR